MNEDYTRSEQIVLGSILTSTDAAEDVAPLLIGTDYASVRHGLIHDAVITLATSGQPHDAIAVGVHLGENGDLERAGGYSYLTELAGHGLAPSSATWHAGHVREASLKRQVRTLGSRLEYVADTDAPALEILDEARGILDSLAHTDTQHGSRPLPQVTASALDGLTRAPGVPTPWPTLTSALGGWKDEELIVCAARPSVGKSVVALEAALDAARRGKMVLLFSLEMSAEDLTLRMLCNIGSVDGQRIQTRTLREVDWTKLEEAKTHLDGLPIIIDDRANLSVAQIRTKVRTVKRRRDLGLVIVDYLGKVKPPADAPRNDRRVQVDQISWGLKEVAREHHVPVLAMAQLNRAIEARSDKAPILSDLRESGGIEADADIVLLMHRVTNPDKGDPSDLAIHVGKNRRGPQSTVHLDFAGHYSRATEPAWTPTSALDRSA